MSTPRIRKGQAPARLDRAAFGERFRARFADPAFRTEDAALARLEAIAWDAFQDGRKAPVTRPAGRGHADPSYEAAVEWLDTSRRLKAAERTFRRKGSPTRALVICGSPRNDGTCPGEMSKSYRLAKLVCAEFDAARITPDLLDLSLVTSEYGRAIHPCKGCVSTAMPLCHWPCSCYPNHSLGQVGDWMNEIYERWVRAHAVVIVTPVHWYQSPSPLKLMIDRLVCADGGNPDVSSTHGKTVSRAKALELAGWPYPKHLAGRAYGLVVHGDVAGIEGSRRALSDWLDWMGLVAAGPISRLDRYIGYYEPYATSHATLDHDRAVQDETRAVAREVARVTRALRDGRLRAVQENEPRVRPK